MISTIVRPAGLIRKWRITLILLLLLESLTACRVTSDCRPADLSCSPLLGILLYQKVRVSKYLYAASNLTTVASFAITESTGELRQVGTQSAPSAAGQPAADALGHFVAVPQFGGGQLSVYAVQPDGSLAAPTALTLGNSPQVATWDVFGRFILESVGTPGNSVATIVPGASTIKSSVTVNNPRGGTPSSDGRFLFVPVNGTSLMEAYQIQGDGTLSFINSAPYTGTALSPVIDPTGRFLFAATNTPAIFAFSIASNGALTALNSQATGTTPTRPFVEPLGRYVYVANSGTNDMSAFSIAANGSLTTISVSVVTGSFPVNTVGDLAGKYLYVPNNTTGDISIFTISSNGLPVLLTTHPVGAAMQEMVIDVSGKYGYVTSTGAGVSAFLLGSGGLLTTIGNYPLASPTPPALSTFYVF